MGLRLIFMNPRTLTRSPLRFADPCNRIVIPTGADQDFLLHAASSDHVCDSLPSFPARVPEQRIPNQTPTRFRNAGGNTRLSNKIYPTESTNQLIGQL
jgi:hypothetical protein